MPRALGPCSTPGCPLLALKEGRCARHPRPARTHALSAARRGLGYAWRVVAAEVLERDGHTCRYCGGPASGVDHRIPRRVGGPSEPWNLVAACRPCNSKKH